MRPKTDSQPCQNVFHNIFDELFYIIPYGSGLLFCKTPLQTSEGTFFITYLKLMETFNKIGHKFTDERTMYGSLPWSRTTY